MGNGERVFAYTEEELAAQRAEREAARAAVMAEMKKALKWLRNGAQPSDTVRNYLSAAGVMKAFHEEKAAKKAEKK